MRALEKKVKANESGVIAINGGELLSNKEVRVIVLLEDEYDDISEENLLKLASQNSVFDFFKDEPDIYSINDGVPYKRPSDA
jgi:hypothetical protein